MALSGIAVAGMSALTTGCGDSADDYVYTGANNGGTNPVFADPENFPGIPGQNIDIVVLNYALSLEYLEADLYRQALNTASGLPLTTPFSSNPNSYLQEFGQVEDEHSDFLPSAISNAGGTPVPVFAFDFGLEAMDRQQVTTLVYLAELTGVSAYLGAIPSFSTRTYVPVAAAVLGTEARHTAALAATLNGDPFNQTPPIATAPFADDTQGRDTPATPDQVLHRGFSVADRLTPATGGTMGPVSGPNGFVYDPATVPVP